MIPVPVMAKATRVQYVACRRAATRNSRSTMGRKVIQPPGAEPATKVDPALLSSFAWNWWWHRRICQVAARFSSGKPRSSRHEALSRNRPQIPKQAQSGPEAKVYVNQHANGEP